MQTFSLLNWVQSITFTAVLDNQKICLVPMIGKCFAEKRKAKKELKLSREGKNGNIAEIIKD